MITFQTSDVRGDANVSEPLLRSWIEAIQNDNVADITNILAKIKEDVKTILLKNKLPKWLPYQQQHAINKEYPFFHSSSCYSLHIACATGSLNVLKLLLNLKEINILEKDDFHLNIVHVLVYYCFLRIKYKSLYLKCFEWLSRNLELETLKILLREENIDGFNPLELAANLQQFAFFTDIFNTEGIYLIKKETWLFMSYKWYDVTDYEGLTSSRHDKSPLLIFSLMDYSALEESVTQEFLSSSAITTWFNKEYQASKQITIMSVLYHLLKTIILVLLFTSSIVKDGLFPHAINLGTNSSAYHYSIRPRRECLLTMLPFWAEILFISWSMIHSVNWLVFGSLRILSMKKNLKLLHDRHKKKPRSAISPIFYFYVECLVNVCVVVKIMSSLLGYYTSLRIPETFTNATDILFTFVLVWSLMFAVQMTPIGHFVVMIQNMLGDVARFSILVLLFQLAFSWSFFMNITMYGKDCDRGHPGFSSIQESFYGIFSLMLNIISPENYVIENKASLCLLHVLYIVMVPVMLINLLIALFSKSVSRVAPYEPHILTFQHYIISTQVVHFISRMSSNYHNNKLRSVFDYKDGKLFLVVIEQEDNNRGAMKQIHNDSVANTSTPTCIQRF